MDTMVFRIRCLLNTYFWGCHAMPHNATTAMRHRVVQHCVVAVVACPPVPGPSGCFIKDVMKLPISWLKEYVDFNASPEELAEKLTFSGTEVENIATIGADYDGIVVGKVLSIKQHPNADRLRLCLVDNGKEEISVVCGANN